MLAAESAGKSPRSSSPRSPEGAAVPRGLSHRFDNWHSTHSAENTELSQDIYRKLKAAGLVYTKPVEQFYDPVKGIFLADRYIKGECPNCGAKDQYGRRVRELRHRVHRHGAEKPVFDALRRSAGAEELRAPFLQALRSEMPRLPQAMARGAGPAAAAGRKQGQGVAQGTGDRALADWDISRDPPYFGIRIPDIKEEKYLYVWLDAPVGYLASFKNYCAKKGLDFEKLLQTRRPSRSISSARTSSTSTPCSGRRC